ncbi:flagellar protein [Moorella thermoacetica]|uniref:Flagellar protein n=2 Tax=Neomoorella thermoacetica TaxID=1525 RepID=A0A1J5JM66_NEOTH|nr:flagellar biosynthetic protein FliO [Moorella thermoacetica]AKX93534.1 flagellar biosynthesis protein, FliO [Moorella thermoacetica]AKX96181.1 flagellar biosynthesis protein, FliO [Moorella thermoacetica]OIQ09812.1 flagellar biosynthesis protein, FliO [Moorella thermoacetica]OIQ55393.1 flagellar biosynthesis protein, FliO [Moorella thermoacetica]QCZ99991.1 Flagellar biosynthesis protein, FliO [Moorella thermoacetica]
MDRELVLALVRLAIFLPLVLALAYITVRFGLGRVTGLATGSGNLEVLERVQLSNKTGLAVIRCGERYFLVGLGDGPPALLAELPDYPAEVAEAGEIKVYPLQSLEKGEPGAVTGGTGRVAELLQAGWQRLRRHDG